jgi:methionyl aminopeptidase
MGLLARLLTVLRGSSGGTADLQLEERPARATEAYLSEARRLAPAVSDILAEVGASVVPGTTTLAINEQIDRGLRAAGLEPAMKGYRDYPMSSTVSLNEEVLHAIPSQRRVQDGDLLKIQTAGRGKEGFVAQGWTFGVGSISAESARLISTASEALRAAQAVIRAGVRTGDVGATIQETAEREGMTVIRQFLGSGIGRQLHQEPPLPCHGVRGRGRRLKTGEVLHVHVILKEGSPDLRIADDGWTALAADGRRGVIHSCMMEVEPDGCRLLGRFPDR